MWTVPVLRYAPGRVAIALVWWRVPMGFWIRCTKRNGRALRDEVGYGGVSRIGGQDWWLGLAARIGVYPGPPTGRGTRCTKWAVASEE